MKEVRKGGYMQTDRRTFFRQSLLLSCAPIIGTSMLKAVYRAVADTESDLISRMR